MYFKEMQKYEILRRPLLSVFVSDARKTHKGISAEIYFPYKIRIKH